MNIVEELRSKTSRDNRELLDRAADEIEKYQVINKLLEGDIADRDKMLEAKVEEVYADFMRDYKCMREELDDLYDLLNDKRNDFAEILLDLAKASRNYFEIESLVKSALEVVSVGKVEVSE